ncbi:MAG: PAS domain S-box protein, partial [Pseudomonadota bacterium]
LLIPPEQLPDVRQIFDELVEGGGPNYSTNDWFSKTGERRTISWSNTVARDASGAIEYVVGTGRDITDYLATEAALRNNRSLLQMIIATSPDAVVTIDSSGRIESFNASAEEMFGYSAQELVGLNVNILMPEPYAAAHDRYLAHYRTTKERRIICIGREVAGKRKDGSVFPIELAVGEVELDGRQLFTGFIRDISRRRNAEEALRASLERQRELQGEFHHVSRLSAMGEMAATLAHELNQPLTAVINYVQACRRLLEADTPEAAARLPELIGKATEQAHRAGDIISHIRGFVTRGDAERGTADLNAVIRQASGLALVGTQAEAIDVTMDLSDELPDVIVDSLQIQQVVVNLVRNSVDALQDCTERAITVRTWKVDEDRVAVSVSDNGPGLDPGIAEKLFEPFNTTKENGMGIGLSVCRSIVQEHGGAIEAIPNPDGGVRFEFWLPIEG